jgi:hypothetical protein
MKKENEGGSVDRGEAKFSTRKIYIYIYIYRG